MISAQQRCRPGYGRYPHAHVSGSARFDHRAVPAQGSEGTERGGADHAPGGSKGESMNIFFCRLPWHVSPGWPEWCFSGNHAVRPLKTWMYRLIVRPGLWPFSSPPRRQKHGAPACIPVICRRPSWYCSFPMIRSLHEKALIADRSLMRPCLQYEPIL